MHIAVIKQVKNKKMVGRPTIFNTVRISYALLAILFLSSKARNSIIVEAKNRTLGRTVVADKLKMPETMAIIRKKGNNFNMIDRIFISKIE
jgi:hypothetical protein